MKAQRRRSNPRMVYVVGDRQVPKEQGQAMIIEASRIFRANQERERLLRRVERLSIVPERHSVAKAMLSVEDRLVRAFWTIARQPGAVILSSGRCGLSYIHERDDVHARYADAAGGKWESIAPRPSLPSSRDIDSANAALDWLLLIDDEHLRKLLVVGATSKRGDSGRRIGWERLRPALPSFSGVTIRTLQRKYQEALRIIVSELTLARLSPLSHKCA